MNKLYAIKIKRKSLQEEAKILRLERRKNRAKARELRKFAKAGDTLNNDRPKNPLDIVELELKSGKFEEYKQDILSRLNELDFECQSMTHHNREIIRKEARSCHIAYSLMLGNEYPDIEESVKPHNFPDWKRIQSILKSFTSHNQLSIEISKYIEAHDKAKKIIKGAANFSHNYDNHSLRFRGH